MYKCLIQNYISLTIFAEKAYLEWSQLTQFNSLINSLLNAIKNLNIFCINFYFTEIFIWNNFPMFILQWIFINFNIFKEV